MSSLANKGISIDPAILNRAIANGARVQDSDGTDVTEDEAFLNTYVVEKQSPKEDKEKLNQVLSEIGGTDDTAAADAVTLTDSPKLNALQTQVDNKGVSTDRNRARTTIEDVQARQQIRKNAQTGTQKTITNLSENVGTPIIEKGKGVVNKISQMPTLGSIGLLVGLLVFLLFIVVSVDDKGTTRIKQLWYMINGRAKLIGRVNVVKGSQGGHSTDVTGGQINGGDPSINNAVGGALGLPPITKGKLQGVKQGSKVNYSANITGDTNQLNRDLLLGSGNLFGANPGDIADTADALKQVASLNKDFGARNDANVINDINALQVDLNKLNETQYNGDYTTIYRDLGF